MVRAIIIGVVVGLVMRLTAAGGTPPTRADLLKTVQHIQSLAKEQEQALDQAKIQHAQVAQALSQATRDNTILQSQVNAITDKLNKTQDKLDKAEKKLWYYRIHWFIGWIVLGAGIILSILFFVLKFTSAGAVLASKL